MLPITLFYTPCLGSRPSQLCLTDYTYLCPWGPSHPAWLKLTPPSFLTLPRLLYIKQMQRALSSGECPWLLPQSFLVNRVSTQADTIKYAVLAFHALMFCLLVESCIVLPAPSSQIALSDVHLIPILAHARLCVFPHLQSQCWNNPCKHCLMLHWIQSIFRARTICCFPMCFKCTW